MVYEKFGRAEKLLMKIRALKWQASTTLASMQDGSAREQAAAVVAELDALETDARHASTEEALARGEQQVEAVAQRLASRSSA
jgi:hypothetical protein